MDLSKFKNAEERSYRLELVAISSKLAEVAANASLEDLIFIGFAAYCLQDKLKRVKP